MSNVRELVEEYVFLHKYHDKKEKEIASLKRQLEEAHEAIDLLSAENESSKRRMEELQAKLLEPSALLAPRPPSSAPPPRLVEQAARSSGSLNREAAPVIGRRS